MNKLRKIPFLLLLLPLVAAILLWHYIHPQTDININIPKVYLAQITTIPQQRHKTIRAEAQLLWQKDSLGVSANDKQVLLYISRDSLSETLTQGDSLLIYGSITSSSRGNPFEYNYSNYLRTQGIFGVMYLNDDNWHLLGHKTLYSIRAIAERCRERYMRILKESGLNGQELGIVAAMTIGEKDELDYETRRQYSVAGAAHVLAISGLHTGIVYGAIVFLLSGFGMFPILYKHKRRRWIVTILSLILIWCYAILVGMSASVMRAALMITIFSLGAALKRESFFSLNTLCAAAFFNLIIQPASLFSISFQLSYTAVLGIILFYKKISGVLHFRNRIIRELWRLLSVSIAAQLGTIPVTLWYFQQTSNYFAFTNLIVIPLASLIVYFSFALVLFYYVPYLYTICSFLTKYSALALNKSVAFIEQLPFSSSNISITTPMLICLVFSIFLLYLLLHYRKWSIFAMFVLSLCLTSFFHYIHLNDIKRQQNTIIYNTHPYTLVLNQQGRQCTLFTDSIDAALKISEPFRKHLMIRAVNTIDLSGKEVCGFQCNNKTFLWLKPKKGHRIQFNSKVDCDVALVGGRGKVYQKDIIKHTTADTVILLNRQLKAITLSP